MVGWKDNQEGSPSRDRFKLLHKQLMASNHYALDADLELVEKEPIPFIVARLDFKCLRDRLTFSEGIAYNEYRRKIAPVYIVEAQHTSTEFKDLEPEQHRFNVYRFVCANWRPQQIHVEQDLIEEELTWQELEVWEQELRNQRQAWMKKFFCIE